VRRIIILAAIALTSPERAAVKIRYRSASALTRLPLRDIVCGYSVPCWG
jgi:hypothetical protein